MVHEQFDSNLPSVTTPLSRTLISPRCRRFVGRVKMGHFSDRSQENGVVNNHHAGIKFLQSSASLRVSSNTFQ